MPLDLLDRQARIIEPRMGSLTAIVAGAGMVGSWAALALVRAGVNVHVFDNDKVEGHNVGVQAYDGRHVGLNKVDALSSLAGDPEIAGHIGLFPAANEWSDYDIEDHSDVVVVCAVDSMAGRREIAEWSRDNHVGLFIETGVQAELVVVKTAITPEDYERYLKELPTDDQVEEPQCGLKGTAYAGMCLAAQIVPLVNGWCKGDTLPPTRLFHAGYWMKVEVSQPAPSSPVRTVNPSTGTSNPMGVEGTNRHA
jgi:molybdopterin/thiamine biosynthesis adenylyltransferase